MPEHKDYEHRVLTTEAERMAITAAKLASNDTMNEFFASFGVDRANFKSMEDFKGDVRFLRELHRRKDIANDLQFLSSVRAGASGAGKRVAYIVIGIIITAFMLGMGSALRSWVVFVFTGKYPH